MLEVLIAKMELFLKLSLCLIVITFNYNVQCFDMSEDKIQVAEFDVQPTGQSLSVKKDWEEANFSCNFTYKATGGTKETWLMGMSVNNEHTQFSCHVERPGSSSYLFFQEFTMSLYGARIAEAEVKGPDHKPLKQDEFKLDEASSSVSHVEGKFQSMLGNVAAFGVRPKEEL